jgi:hypothetical protein
MKANLVIRRARAGVIWRPVFATFIVAVLIFGAGVYGELTADSRMAPEVKAALNIQRYLAVAVVLDFSPEDFHMKYFQALGTMAGVNGTTVLIRRIRADDVREIAGNYWIRRIELLPAS